MLKHGKIGDTNASRLSHLLTELAKKISNLLGDSGERATEVPGLMLYRRTAPTVPNPSTYEPSLLVIAQGRIRVDLGKAKRFRPIEISPYVSGTAGCEPGDYGQRKGALRCLPPEAGYIDCSGHSEHRGSRCA